MKKENQERMMNFIQKQVRGQVKSDTQKVIEEKKPVRKSKIKPLVLDLKVKPKKFLFGHPTFRTPKTLHTLRLKNIKKQIVSFDDKVTTDKENTAKKNF